jgi:hypothetical protein
MIRIPALKTGSKGRSDKSSLLPIGNGSAPPAGTPRGGASLRSDLEVPLETILDSVEVGISKPASDVAEEDLELRRFDRHCKIPCFFESLGRSVAFSVVADSGKEWRREKGVGTMLKMSPVRNGLPTIDERIRYYCL